MRLPAKLLHRKVQCGLHSCRATFAALLVAVALPSVSCGQTPALPTEPVAIGHEPCYLVDDLLIDNYFSLRYKQEDVVRVFHPPVKHAGNPVISGEGGYPTVTRDPETGRFLMLYQVAVPRLDADGNRKGSNYAIACAESTDGLSWQRPELGLLEWEGTKQNNVVWKGISGKRASSPFLLELPGQDRRGYRYIMSYLTSGGGKGEGGIHLVGSHDGIHWDRDSDRQICDLGSDTLNSIVYDPARDEYVMFCRAKHIYRTFRGDIRETGASRRIARLSSKELWTDWKPEPQNILIPDATDAAQRFNFFYGMPARYHAGLYWGFVWPFRMNTIIVTQLATSRDGIRFARLPGHPRLLDLGEEGTWDDSMAMGTGWVEVGDEWWIYYVGYDGPHGQPENRTPGIGLARLKRGRFVSLRGPRQGGVVITRRLRWPGGPLLLNANAASGEVRVRVSDARRKVLDGFDYADCQPLTTDSLTHEVRWGNRSLAALAGQELRLEILLHSADLFSFQAGTPSEPQPE